MIFLKTEEKICFGLWHLSLSTFLGYSSIFGVFRHFAFYSNLADKIQFRDLIANFIPFPMIYLITYQFIRISSNVWFYYIKLAQLFLGLPISVPSYVLRASVLVLTLTSAICYYIAEHFWNRGVSPKPSEPSPPASRQLTNRTMHNKQHRWITHNRKQ